ncbi:MAG: hypothetical protein GY873_30230 [Bosea sp.]|uniref:hypothetical protein n=1 Tax=Bosea sp. (in: a-proteobacteria) TaxID=1871050 RepID=UPI0023A422F0|nr:hypothetical protein [Bosea sp. (in: a-proteobacteria)]MCP4738474.1 hypothetical protein [Bosea sp. (in: a-proteobacteria)]
MITAEVMDAVEVAAGSGDGTIMESGAHRSVSPSRIAATRNTILRFLENVPEEMTALEMREAIEEAVE